MLQNRLFSAFASRSGFGAAISDTVARSSIAFSNSVSADRIVMAASRLAWSQKYWEVVCASFVVLGNALCKLCSTKWYWELFCASFVVQSSTGTCLVQAL